jgi:hypothetical protein
MFYHEEGGSVHEMGEIGQRFFVWEQKGEIEMNSKQWAGIWVGLGTAPLLAGVLGARAIALAIQELGCASEEVFRGDRLPILKITPPDMEG